MGRSPEMREHAGVGQRTRGGIQRRGLRNQAVARQEAEGLTPPQAGGGKKLPPKASAPGSEGLIPLPIAGKYCP